METGLLRAAFAKKVAVTGGVATGKSTVVRMLGEMGLRTASADEVAGRLFAEPDFQSGLARELGMDFPIDRGELRRRTFEETGFRRRLNAYYHRPVLEVLAADESVVVEVPLLIEAGLGGWFGASVAVVCDLDDQVRRLTERLGDLSLAEGFLRSQLPLSVKSSLCDYSVRTSCPEDAVFSQAKELVFELKKSVSLGRV